MTNLKDNYFIVEKCVSLSSLPSIPLPSNKKDIIDGCISLLFN